jgi:hypothetical protein
MFRSGVLGFDARRFPRECRTRNLELVTEHDTTDGRTLAFTAKPRSANLED